MYKIFENTNQNGPIQYIILHKTQNVLTIYENPVFYEINPALIIENPIHKNKENPLFNIFLGHLDNLVKQGKMPKFTYSADLTLHKKLHKFKAKQIIDHDYHTHFYFDCPAKDALKALQKAIDNFQKSSELRKSLINLYYNKELKKTINEDAMRAILNVKLFDDDLINIIKDYNFNTKNALEKDSMLNNADNEPHPFKGTQRDLLSIDVLQNDNMPFKSPKSLAPSSDIFKLDNPMFRASMLVPQLLLAVCLIILVYKSYKAITPCWNRFSSIFKKSKSHSEDELTKQVDFTQWGYTAGKIDRKFL